MVLLYDRTFLSESFREAWRRRKLLYLGLACTWVLLGFVLAYGQLPVTTANARRLGVTWWQYLATQPGVILHYLRLSVWPDPLCFDYYGWPIARTWPSIVPPALVIVALLGSIIWAWRTNTSRRGEGLLWGFWGAWFFLILAPSSSVIPLDSPAYEHRMYLPLAAVVVLAVLGIHAVARRRSVAVFSVLVIALSFLTWRRNQDYRSALAIWQDTVLKRPDNARAHVNLGAALKQLGQLQDEIEQYQQALRLKPDNIEAHNNLGNALLGLNRVPEAVARFEQAVRFNPGFAEAHNNLGVALVRLDMIQKAIGHWEQALRLKPDFAEAHNNLGLGLMRVGRVQEAIGHYEQALRLKPDYADAHYNLGLAMEQLGRVRDAISHYEQALRIKPDYVEVQQALARLRFLAG
jgi:tetratricopeptide (TPR) repeat protein